MLLIDGVGRTEMDLDRVEDAQLMHHQRSPYFRLRAVTDTLLLFTYVLKYSTVQYLQGQKISSGRPGPSFLAPRLAPQLVQLSGTRQCRTRYPYS